MSTDSTELTFVRCPSCRSLVPAVSTRCRMCGATLDAAAAQNSESEQKSSSRVRQRTMSQPQSELTSAVGKLREEFSEPEAAEATSSDPVMATDPLSAYVEEVEVGESDDLDDEVLDDMNEPPAPSAATGSIDAAPEEANGNGHSPMHVSPPVESKNGGSHIPLGTVAENEPKPRVLVESGSRRGPGSGGLSFGRPKGEKPKDETPAPEIKSPPMSPPRMETREQEPTGTPINRAKSRPEPEAPREQGKAPESVKKIEKSTGRLFGWLVSYADSDGTAIELREGKFFVSGSSLKETDMVIPDSSVSTPHALVTVALDGGLQVQDLMSDRGVFVRRREEVTYQRESEILKLNHGDWVRFGDVEFLVSLIAHVGMK